MLRSLNKKPPHPGTILKNDFLYPKNLTVKHVAERLRIARTNLSLIINGKASISPEMAIKLSKAFNTPPELWMNLQLSYDLWKAEKKIGRIRIDEL
jgi:antitoxin HigA-1